MKTQSKLEIAISNRIESTLGFLLRHRIAALVIGAAACVAMTPPASAVSHKLNTDEMKMFQLVSGSRLQKRTQIHLDPILCKVARQRAADMAKRNYFSHVNPNGQGPNYLAKRAGFMVPSYYDQSVSGNNIESIAMTPGNSKEVFGLWLNSDGHRVHLLGDLDFYKQQSSVGVGVFRSPVAPHYKYYVFLSSPANASARPPLVILKNSKGKVIASTRPIAPGIVGLN